MKDEELLAEFTEIRKVPQGIVLRVQLITWPHPHTPRARWHTVTTFPSDTDEAELANARRSTLANPNYFRVCTECNTRKPVGWMHSEVICQSCAEQRHGVVY